MADKAVSTEDLCADCPPQNGYLGVVRLEAFLNTLVENKVEALKSDNRRTLSMQTSPKTILNRLRFKSSPTILTRPSCTEEVAVVLPKRTQKIRYLDTCPEAKKQEFKREVSISSPESHSRVKSLDESSEEPSHLVDNPQPVCYCTGPTNITHQFDDDYVSLKIDGYAEDTEAMMAEEVVRRARKKRRRRRKRRMKKRMAMNVLIDPTLHVEDKYKVIDADELPQRARWTIVITACILLFMCLLLVGITLRMAPLIDDMVRKENEELLNSLQSGSSVHNVS